MTGHAKKQRKDAEIILLVLFGAVMGCLDITLSFTVEKAHQEQCKMHCNSSENSTYDRESASNSPHNGIVFPVFVTNCIQTGVFIVTGILVVIDCLASSPRADKVPSKRESYQSLQSTPCESIEMKATAKSEEIPTMTARSKAIPRQRVEN